MNNRIETYKSNFLTYVNKSIDTEITAFAFGDTAEMADELGELVLEGEKTGTTSGYDLYTDSEIKPYAGQYQIVLDSQENPLCIIENLSVEILPFKEISKEHARKEGEGDKSLAYWRKAHLEFFPKYYKEELGIEFSEDCLVIFEEFQVVYQ